MRPDRIDAAFLAMGEACSDLGAHKRRGNFFRSTLNRIDEEDETLCSHMAEIRAYLEALEAENGDLRERLGMELKPGRRAPGSIEVLSECTGECAAELAQLAKREPEALRAKAAEHGLYLDDDAIGEADEIIAAKAAGHECSTCQKGSHHHV